MNDATEYEFGAAGRRILVRGGQEDVGVEDAAHRYQSELETVLAASEVHVEGVAPTEGGAQAVVVTGVLPRQETNGEGGTESIVRTVFLRFGSRPLAELTLYARADDDGAEAEFRHLLQTAQPSRETDAARQVARAIEAGPVGRSGYPAGPIELQLGADYRGPERFTLASADDTVRYRIESTTAEAVATRSVTEGTMLGSGVGVARDEEGRAIRYEAGVRPRLYSRRGQVEAEADPVAFTLRGLEGASSVPAPGEVVIDGSVRGKPIRMRVTVPDGQSDGKRLGDELMRAMNQAE